MADTIITKKVTDLTENTAVSDEDLFLVGNAGTAALRKVKWSSIFSKINELIKAKVLEWTFENLRTTDKTLVGAVNELNTNLSGMSNCIPYYYNGNLAFTNGMATLPMEGKITKNAYLSVWFIWDMNNLSGSATVSDGNVVISAWNDNTPISGTAWIAVSGILEIE